MDKAKYARLNYLLKELGKRPDEKIEMVINVTEGRAQSSKDLTDKEFVILINKLQTELGAGEQPKWLQANKMRKKILSMCHELGLHQYGTTKIDMTSVDKLCREHTYLKKGLNAYSLSELPKLVSQFEVILKKYYNQPDVKE